MEKAIEFFCRIRNLELFSIDAFGLVMKEWTFKC